MSTAKYKNAYIQYAENFDIFVQRRHSTLKVKAINKQNIIMAHSDLYRLHCPPFVYQSVKIVIIIAALKKIFFVYVTDVFVTVIHIFILNHIFLITILIVLTSVSIPTTPIINVHIPSYPCCQKSNIFPDHIAFLLSPSCVLTPSPALSTAFSLSLPLSLSRHSTLSRSSAF